MGKKKRLEQAEQEVARLSAKLEKAQAKTARWKAEAKRLRAESRDTAQQLRRLRARHAAPLETPGEPTLADQAVAGHPLGTPAPGE